MRTVMYLLRHGATDANLTRPALIQGRKHNPPLAPLGVRQAELTRDFLAVRPIECCYCSPLVRATQTAEIVSAPHGLDAQPVEALIECDVGRWEGLDWGAIRQREPESYHRFMKDPAAFGYPGGESLGDVYDRAAPELERLLEAHAGGSILVVAHNVVNRTFLAVLLGLTPGQARRVSLDNCGISVVLREDDRTIVTTLNAAFHLQGLAAA